MGYTTDFFGCFNFDRPLAPKHVQYLTAFSDTRRMKRNEELVSGLPDPKREAVGLGIGRDGGYYVGSEEDFGQNRTADILDYNHPPSGQPGLWCKWIPTEDGERLEWSGAEKFYDYVEWLEYLIKHFIKPWGYKLNGEVEWQGEERSDMGRIIVKNNVVTTQRAHIEYR